MVIQIDNGSAYGNGIYYYGKTVDISLGYSTPSSNKNGWPQSTLAKNPSCILVCEAIKKSNCNKYDNGIHVIPDEQDIATRYIILYGQAI